MSGSKGARASPDLIAACHVLHRLSTPRHPSEALMRLIVLSKTHAWLCAGQPLGKSGRRHTCALYLSDNDVFSGPPCKRRQTPRGGLKRRTDPSFTMSSPGRREAAGKLVTITSIGGARRDRTDDLMLAKHPLYQLSYGPSCREPLRRACRPIRGVLRRMVGLGRLELPTLRLSGVRSNHLSYRPMTAAQDGSCVPGLAIAPRPRTAMAICWKEKRRRRRPAPV
jgi:hypothetical protein